eukprot:12001181-Karenia_brevis.AAC.1
MKFQRIFKSAHKPFDQDSLLVFYNDEPMCISHNDTGEIVVQLEFVEEKNTVLIKCNDSDYTH